MLAKFDARTVAFHLFITGSPAPVKPCLCFMNAYASFGRVASESSSPSPEGDAVLEGSSGSSAKRCRLIRRSMPLDGTNSLYGRIWKSVPVVSEWSRSRSMNSSSARELVKRTSAPTCSSTAQASSSDRDTGTKRQTDTSWSGRNA